MLRGLRRTVPRCTQSQRRRYFQVSDTKSVSFMLTPQTVKDKYCLATEYTDKTRMPSTISNESGWTKNVLFQMQTIRENPWHPWQKIISFTGISFANLAKTFASFAVNFNRKDRKKQGYLLILWLDIYSLRC